MLSCETWKIFKSTYFEEHMQWLVLNLKKTLRKTLKFHLISTPGI